MAQVQTIVNCSVGLNGNVHDLRIGTIYDATESIVLAYPWAFADVAGGSTVLYTAKQSAEVTCASNVTAVNIPGLTFSLVAGRRYWFKFSVKYQTAATTTGLGLLFSAPAMTDFADVYFARQAAAGTDMFYEASAGVATTALVSTAVAQANVPYLAWIEGHCTPSADGALQLQCLSEVNTSLVTVLDSGVGFLVDCG